MPARGTRVALHARYSSDRQSDNSIADQMRIIEDELRARAQARLAVEALHGKFRESRPHRHLLSGNEFCGVCDGAFSSIGGQRCACNNAQRHLCRNKKSLDRPKLGAQVMEVLAQRMTDAELAELFAEEFSREWNRLAAEADGARARLQRELQTVNGSWSNSWMPSPAGYGARPSRPSSRAVRQCAPNWPKPSPSPPTFG